MRENIYSIEWTNKAAKQFKAIDDQKLREHILDIIENEIARNPLTGKPLTFVFKGVYSYRLGQLRILYKPYKERLVVVILKIEHRRSVY